MRIPNRLIYLIEYLIMPIACYFKTLSHGNPHFNFLSFISYSSIIFHLIKPLKSTLKATASLPLVGCFHLYFSIPSVVCQLFLLAIHFHFLVHFNGFFKFR